MEDTILTARDLKFRYDPEQPVYAPVSYTHLDVYKRQLLVELLVFPGQ